MATNRKNLPKKQKKMSVVKARKADRPVVDTYIRPESFPNFAAAFGFAKKAVYSVTRIRKVNGTTEVNTLGTAFLVGPNKLLTCAHVLNSVEPDAANIPMAHHQDGDTYYLLNRDQIDKSHYYHFVGRVGKNLSIYPQADAAVITVGDDFYQLSGRIMQHRDVYLKLASTPYDIGAEAGILGFPAERDEKKNVQGLYLDPTTGDLIDELVKKRVDRGVINAHYVDQQDSLIKYDFTMAFNPGNSGGPIIDDQCKVIAMVRGYRFFPIKVVVENFTVTSANGSQVVPFPSTLKAIYSTGFSSENFRDIISEHGLPA